MSPPVADAAAAKWVAAEGGDGSSAAPMLPGLKRDSLGPVEERLAADAVRHFI